MAQHVTSRPETSREGPAGYRVIVTVGPQSDSTLRQHSRTARVTP